MHHPNVEHLRVDREKVVGYLLAHSYPDGQAKAKFFRRLGFRLEQWDLLADALR